ncbi:hypothetical protein HRbin10_02470 [bacterium HR10]|nr:hypothetical protein HRbin10_02470 [bacterium HR10]
MRQTAMLLAFIGGLACGLTSAPIRAQMLVRDHGDPGHQGLVSPAVRVKGVKLMHQIGRSSRGASAWDQGRHATSSTVFIRYARQSEGEEHSVCCPRESIGAGGFRSFPSSANLQQEERPTGPRRWTCMLECLTSKGVGVSIVSLAACGGACAIAVLTAATGVGALGCALCIGVHSTLVQLCGALCLVYGA